MPGLYGEKWAVSYDTEPPSQPEYFRLEESARQFYDARPAVAGWGVRLFRWDDARRAWVSVERK